MMRKTVLFLLAAVIFTAPVFAADTSIVDPTTPADKAAVLNTAPSGSNFGLIVRNIPYGTQTISGTVTVDNFPSIVNSVSVTNFPATQPVSIFSLPLPSGAATAARQDTANSYASQINAKLPTLSGGRIPVEATVASIALPTGASTSALQSSANTLTGAVTETAPVTDTASSGLNGRLQRVAQRLTSLIALLPTALGQTTMAASFPVVISSNQSAIPVTVTGGGDATAANQVTGNASLSSIDGKITAVNTGAVVVSSSALPALAATSTKQSDGTQKTQIVDGSGNVIGSTANALNVSASFSPSGTQDVNVTQIGGASLALGQQLAAASVPVVLTAAQISTLTPLSSVAVTNAGTFAAQAAQSGVWNITDISGTVSLPTGAATAAKQPALGTAGTSSADVITVQGRAAMTPLLTDSSATTQPVSAASLPLPSGAATEATLSNRLSEATFNAKITGGTQLAQVYDPVNALSAGVKALNVQVVGADNGLVVNSVIHGLTTAGGGAYVDVKVNPSGSLAVEATQGTATNLKTQAETYQGGVAVGAAAPLQVSLANTAANATAVKTDSSATTQPVSIAATVTTSASGNATANVTSVADSASSQTILASNASRKGAIFVNTSDQILYMRFGSGAATITDYTVRLLPNAYYETPAFYTGQITGIWASNSTGAAQVTEVQ